MIRERLQSVAESLKGKFGRRIGAAALIGAATVSAPGCRPMLKTVADPSAFTSSADLFVTGSGVGTMELSNCVTAKDGQTIKLLGRAGKVGWVEEEGLTNDTTPSDVSALWLAHKVFSPNATPPATQAGCKSETISTSSINTYSTIQYTMPDGTLIPLGSNEAQASLAASCDPSDTAKDVLIVNYTPAYPDAGDPAAIVPVCDPKR